MSETPRDYAVCHNCGALLPHGARFCPTCGAAVAAPVAAPVEQPASDDAFRNAIDAALGTSASQPDQPTVQAPIVGPTESELPDESPTSESAASAQSWTPPPPGPNPSDSMQQPTWTATPEQWPADISSNNQTGWRKSRTTWIILAVFGFILFCCCGILFTLFVASAFDDGLQSDITMAVSALI